MSKPRMFRKQFYVNFTPLEWALVQYYAWRYGKDRREIVRTMVNKYIDADRGFDPAGFTRFVKGPLDDVLTDDDDAELRSIMREMSLDYAKSRKGSKAPSRRKRR